MSNAVFHYAFTINRPDARTESDFEEEHADIADFLTDRCERYIFQLERGDGTNRLHYQGYLQLRVKKRGEQLRSEWSETSPGVFLRPSSTAGRTALKAYCLKSATRVAGPWTDRPVYLGQDLPTELFEWQELLKRIMLGRIDDRRIYWVHDGAGGRGKSKFAKYMSYHHKIPKLTFGKSSDLLNLVSKVPNRPAYIFDCSRTVPKDQSMDDIYCAMENVKNGHFTNTKYETEEVLMVPPHIVVFSNYLPDLTKLSRDRWIVVDLEDLTTACNYLRNFV